ncbi:hypothetical protein [Actinokineospora diospyrosa]|nr:hypothetical protein [Actinokineospora diospyrosa]
MSGREGDLPHMFAGALAILREEVEDLPYGVYPQIPGLLPWARCTRPGAGLLFWLVDGGDPDKWPVVLSDLNYDHWEEFDGTAVDILSALVAGELPSQILSRSEGAEPYRPRQARSDAHGSLW